MVTEATLSVKTKALLGDERSQAEEMKSEVGTLQRSPNGLQQRMMQETRPKLNSIGERKRMLHAEERICCWAHVM